MENDKTNAKLGFWEKILANMLEEGGGGVGGSEGGSFVLGVVNSLKN